MRIIGGEYGGRVLRPPMKGWPTRPTTDLAREALYNILSNRIYFEEIRMIDLFGGTGAHVIESISRGCLHATYVEKYGKAVRWMKQCSADLGVEDQVTIINRDVKIFIKDHASSYDLVFADPPYQLPWLGQLPAMILNSNLLSSEGLFVLEHDNQHNFDGVEGFQEQRKYGQTIFSFFKHA